MVSVETVRSAWILALLVTLATSAEAEERGAARARALELFDQSESEYRAGRFDVAAQLLEEAYRLHPQPTLLYNLARAREGGGDFPGAIAAYRQYLAEAGQVKDHGAIEARIATLERTVAEREALLRSKSAVAPAPLILERPPPPPPARSIGPWIVGGAGLLGVSAGVVIGAIGLGHHSAAEAAASQREALPLQNQAEDLGRIANVALIGGAIGLVGGLSWWLIEGAGQP